MPTILIDSPATPEQLASLSSAFGMQAVMAEGDLGKQRELPAAQLRDVVGLLATFLPTNHKEMQSLRFMQLCSAGFKQVENHGLASRGVNVCTASGVNDIPIAEWAVMMILALQRDLPGSLRNQAQGLWDRDARFQSEARGKTLGIWGYGGSARETARLASAIGLRVHVLTRNGRIDDRPRFHTDGTEAQADHTPDHIFSAEQVQAFCADLDFLMLAIPETPANQGLINASIFNALPDTAYLLNPARGKLVNEQDLLAALREKRIAGAALDTHFQYPLPPEHPLWHMPNVIMTPHVAGSSMNPNYPRRLWALFTQNLGRWQRGEETFGKLSDLQLDPGGTPATLYH